VAPHLVRDTGIRVAKWIICIPQIPIWINFRWPWNGKWCYTLSLLEIFMAKNLWPFGIFCCHLVYFPHFSIFRPKKNLATLTGIRFKKILVF
jgi:hypothetical protein